MDRSEIQKLLQSADPAEGASFSEAIAPGILRRGKQLRFFMRRHWKWLRVSSLIALLIAIALGFTLSRMGGEESRPPLLLFQGLSEATPFVTK